MDIYIFWIFVGNEKDTRASNHPSYWVINAHELFTCLTFIALN